MSPGEAGRRTSQLARVRAHAPLSPVRTPVLPDRSPPGWGPCPGTPYPWVLCSVAVPRKRRPAADKATVTAPSSPVTRRPPRAAPRPSGVRPSPSAAASPIRRRRARRPPSGSATSAAPRMDEAAPGAGQRRRALSARPRQGPGAPVRPRLRGLALPHRRVLPAAGRAHPRAEHGAGGVTAEHRAAAVAVRDRADRGRLDRPRVPSEEAAGRALPRREQEAAPWPTP